MTYRVASAIACVAAGMLVGACNSAKRIESFPEKYAGVGLELTVDGDQLTVVRPLKGGPSEAAGIKEGDKITAINGRPTDGYTLGDAVTQLRGRPDSQLTLSIDRKGERILVVMRRQAMKRSKSGRY